MQNQNTIDNTRWEVINLNRKYNKLYHALMSIYITNGNQDVKVAIECMQEMMPEIMAVNKSLHIDCKKYENGEIVKVEGEDGSSPIEILPDELKIDD